ncbi:probable cytochrome P450 9f2 [Contarinia nasturtii]|uniref:probable cytochrome P450 9f2 n=1 Tax=Contarinia nasturtii TaxID=265458 RepID=UPI0012D3E3E0|nr:probable cytochrome P450 9f2 [Contarinia nasturtii]XP_031624490.1 probable cytochrome P450 9f2 [Contarinia nasturtii]XP_031624491.1 probable cytochrome P450 9f2 [Contarinia nasturtii]XP_031624492.1 probable cytochrome P450 9f2 [Contarinia nasturtii]XP_031624494.1 probable cytochrome P450 9f2 [Contarinia nasturtii]
MFGEFLLVAAVSFLIYAFYKWATINNDFFERRNIKYMKPKFLVGNVSGTYINKYTGAEFANELYQAFPNESVYGLFDFRTPQYIIRDPELYKQIAIKDFDHFEDHYAFLDDTSDKLWGNSLFLMSGEKWRQMRATLSPAFTGSKMRQMFELVAECADDVVKHFLEKVEKGEKINIEMKDFFTRYTNDVIATCAFGLKINSFFDPKNEFYLNGKILMDFTSTKSMIKLFFIEKIPKIARALNITFTNPSIANAFTSTILNTMSFRQKNKIYRPDMINMLMQIREGTLKHQIDEMAKEKEGFATVEESEIGKLTVKRTWTDDEIVAQCFIFFIAGFETSATILTFTVYEIATNPDIQQKLYEEVVKMSEQLGGKSITYDALQKMKYLDQVICEVLRKWPPGFVVDRLCTKDYNYDDGEKLKLKAEKGDTFIFPVYAIHHDPKYFPNPEKFDPERFSDENKNSIISGTYLPFGIGPRNCIGSRFALMEIKAILYNLLLNFSFEPNEKTQIPLILKKSSFSLDSENGVHLELKPRQK